MGKLIESELARGLSAQALLAAGVGFPPDKARTTYPLTVESMRRCLRLHAQADVGAENNKIAAADILARAGFTMTDIVEHLNEVMAEAIP